MKRLDLKNIIIECIQEITMLEEKAEVDDAYKALYKALKKSKAPNAKKQLAALKKMMGQNASPIKQSAAMKKANATNKKNGKKTKAIPMKTGNDGTYGYNIRGCGSMGHISGC